MHNNNKPVNILNQLVIEVEREQWKKKLPCCIILCAFRCIIKFLYPEVFYYLSEKLPLSQNLHYFRGAVSHNVLYYQQLAVTHNQVSFYANNYFEYLPIVSSSFKHLKNLNINIVISSYKPHRETDRVVQDFNPRSLVQIPFQSSFLSSTSYP